MKNTIKKHTIILNQMKKWFGIVVVLAAIAQLTLHPSLDVFLGCMMSLVSYMVFSFFLKKEYVQQYPFAFLMYMSMFFYRYLPLIATLTEDKKITYGLQLPYDTFGYEMLLFLVSSLAFFLACNPFKIKKNNILQKTLYRLNFYKVNPMVFWGIGIVGVVSRLATFQMGDAEFGDVSGKFLMKVNFLIYAPLCLFFPSLIKLPENKSKFKLWCYFAIIIIINIASNSRRHIIMPIATFFLLYFLYIVKENIQITTLISPFKIITILVFVIFGLNFITDLSMAMLKTRAIRSDLSKKELFDKTIQVLQNESEMETLRAITKQKTGKLKTYNRGWNEAYLDNFMLNRYANIRITDQTLYYAHKMGFASKKMQDNLAKKLLAILPTPVLKPLGIDLDKSEVNFSRGDYLYKQRRYSFVVTSHVGDGLATFGHLYFLIQFVFSFLVFKLLNTFVFFTKNGFIYAPFALFNVFTFLGMFRNANGIYDDIGYCLRGYIESVFIYLLAYYMVVFFVKVFFKAKNTQYV